MKVDMSKPYDRVEWSFFCTIMEGMRFAESWIELIMSCISFVSYLVIINGSKENMFKLNRGLRQGDLLSSFLFLICSEGILILMFEALKDGDLRGF